MQTNWATTFLLPWTKKAASKMGLAIAGFSLKLQSLIKKKALPIQHSNKTQKLCAKKHLPY